MLRYGGDPVRALTEAISAGGDTDSIGAILGSWLGALHGAEGLPAALIARYSRRAVRSVASAGPGLVPEPASGRTRLPCSPLFGHGGVGPEPGPLSGHSRARLSQARSFLNGPVCFKRGVSASARRATGRLLNVGTGARALGFRISSSVRPAASSRPRTAGSSDRACRTRGCRSQSRSS